LDRFVVMRSFVSVVKHESFAAAARSLSISRALVSRHIADLEKQVGIRLVNRTTRSVTLTEAGHKYFEFARRILKDIENEDAAMISLREQAEGELSVVSPKWIGSLDLGDAVAAFAAEHPKVHVRLELGGLSERTYDFVEEGFDIAFHTKHLRDSSVMVRKIAPLQFVLCGSANYLRGRELPASPLELAHMDALVHINDPVWHFTRGGKKINYKPQQVAFSSNTYLVLQKAAIRGMGLALLPVRSVYQDIQAGNLEIVLPNYNIPERPLYAAYAPSRHLVRKVRVFVDFIAEWFKQHPMLPTRVRQPPAAALPERKAPAPDN
jgi:DNA-binding transcriptional LysR family regulator